LIILIERETTKYEPILREKLLVDLANILFEDSNNNGKLKVENIRVVYNTLLEANYVPFLIIDASLRHLMNDEKEYEELIKEKIIYQAPAGRKADLFYLKIAKAFKSKFLTNDLCKEYYEEYGKEWIIENRKTFMFIDGKLILE